MRRHAVKLMTMKTLFKENTWGGRKKKKKKQKERIFMFGLRLNDQREMFSIILYMDVTPFD